MVQAVRNDVSRQEGSKNSEMNLELFTIKFSAGWIERVRA